MVSLSAEISQAVHTGESGACVNMITWFYIRHPITACITFFLWSYCTSKLRLKHRIYWSSKEFMQPFIRLIYGIVQATASAQQIFKWTVKSVLHHGNSVIYGKRLLWNSMFTCTLLTEPFISTSMSGKVRAKIRLQYRNHSERTTNGTATSTCLYSCTSPPKFLNKHNNNNM